VVDGGKPDVDSRESDYWSTYSISLARWQRRCYVVGKDVAHSDYWLAFQQIMLDSDGRPHWAKDFQLSADQLRRIHDSGFTRFLEIRNRLDPDCSPTTD